MLKPKGSLFCPSVILFVDLVREVLNRCDVIPRVPEVGQDSAALADSEYGQQFVFPLGGE